MNIKSRIARFLGHKTTLPLRVIKYIAPNVPCDVPEIDETTLSGFPVRIKYSPHSYIGYQLFYCGYYEKQLIKMMYGFYRNGMGFVDIGANYGIYTLALASKNNKRERRGKIYAFEPQPEVYRILKESVVLNGYSNIDIFNCALAEKKGILQMHYPMDNNDGAASLGIAENEKEYRPPIDVNVEVLSDLPLEYLKQNNYIIKIDVEGAEVNVLKGADKLFAVNKPEVILVECVDAMLSRFGYSDEELFTMLQNFDFDIWGLISVGFTRKRCFVLCKNYNEYITKTKRTTQLLAILKGSQTRSKVGESFFI